MAAWCGCVLKVALLAVVWRTQVVHGDLAFRLGSCASNRSREALTFVNSHLSPYPIILPGDFSVTSTLQVFRDITGDITLDVTVERHFGFFKINIPCFHGVGSCQIRDVCGLLRGAYGSSNARCPSQFRRNGVPCTCPVRASSYTMRSGVFHVPHLEALWAWMAQGDYRATARLIDSASGEEIACQQLDLTIRAPCTTFWCRLFGG